MTLPVCVSQCSSRSAGHYLWPALYFRLIFGPSVNLFRLLFLSIAFVSKGSSLGLSQTGQLFSWEVKGAPLRRFLLTVSRCSWCCRSWVWAVALFSSKGCRWIRKAKPVLCHSFRWPLQVASSLGSLPKLIRGGKHYQKTLLDILADGTILKVGVGCSEDASKLPTGLWPHRYAWTSDI